MIDSAANLPPGSSLPQGSSAGSSMDPSAGAALQVGDALSPRTRHKVLSIVNVQATNIPPKESVTYAKQTQTIESGPDVNTRGRGAGGIDYYTLAYNYDDDDEKYEEDSIPGMGSGGSPSSGSPTGYLSKLPPGFLPTGMPEVKDVRPAITRQEEEEAKAKKEKAEEERRRKELSEEEKQVIMMSEEFHRFFNRSTRLVERALWEEPNLFVDYTGVYDGENGEGADGDKAGVHLAFNRYFSDERWTKNRVVTSMDW